MLFHLVIMVHAMVKTNISQDNGVGDLPLSPKISGLVYFPCSVNGLIQFGSIFQQRAMHSSDL